MTVVSRYNLLDEIGRGFMGIVYKATDRLTDQTVALKQIRVNPSNNTMPTLPDADSRLRLAFAQEFHILASLRHPHIISVLDYGFNEKQNPFFTMDYIENASTFTSAGQTKSLDEQANLTIQLLQALTYLHRRDIIHRDLKPANVLVADERVRVLDFGLSSKTGEHIGRSGTLAYMSPEVLQGQGATVQSDLYAVGVMMYEMLTGELPYDPLNVMERFRPPSELKALTDHPLELVITRLLMPDPTDRYLSAEHVIKEIAQTTDVTIEAETAAIRDSFLQTAPFVGREAELNQLKAALTQTMKQLGSVWLIGGESGVGKSRLLEELRIQAMVDGALVVRGQGVEGGGIPYQLWRNILDRLLLSATVTDEEAYALTAIIPPIEKRIGRDLPESVKHKDKQQDLIDAVAQVLRQQPQPVLIILEDLQWTIESLVLMAQLAPLAAAEGWLLIGSYRQDERPDLPDEIPDANVMMLKRLDDATIAELSQAMLGETGKRPEIISLLQEQTEGNAFFLVEVVRTLAEEAGRLADIGRMTLPDIVFSGGIQRISQPRLSRVPAWGQRLLKLAAVGGRQINEATLQHLAGDVSLEQWFSICSSAAVLEVNENEWRFAHDKLRETVVAGCTEEESKLYNREVAEAIEAIYHDELARQAQILANHWHLAGDYNKEAYYCFEAAKLLQHLGLHEAQTFALRGLRCNPSDPLLWAKLSNLIAHNYFEWGDYDKAQQYFDASLAHCRQHKLTHEELTALDGLGQIIYVAKDMEAALKIYEDAVILARELEDNVMLARLLKHQGFVMRFLGDHDGAYRVALDSLEVVKKLDDPHELALILYSVSVIVRNRGKYQEGITYLEEGIAIYRTLNTIGDLGHSLNNLGICHSLLGNHDIALQHLQEGMACRQQVGHVRGVASSKSAIGDLYFATQHYTEAEQMYQEALDFWKEIGDKWNTANSHADVGFPTFVRGDLQAAENHWREAIQRASEIKGTFVILKALIGFAWLACSADKTDYAIDLLSIAQAHEASTRPLAQMWIDPLLKKMQIDSLPIPVAIDLDATIAATLTLEV